MSDNQVSHGELVQRFADALEGMDSKAMVALWNAQFDDEVRYVGDSMYEWVEEDLSVPAQASAPAQADIIPSGLIDMMVANFLETIGNLEAIRGSHLDLDDTAEVVKTIGLRLRAEQPGRGLMLAKLILDRAMSARFSNEIMQ